MAQTHCTGDLVTDFEFSTALTTGQPVDVLTFCDHEGDASPLESLPLGDREVVGRLPLRPTRKAVGTKLLGLLVLPTEVFGIGWVPLLASSTPSLRAVLAHPAIAPSLGALSLGTPHRCDSLSNARVSLDVLDQDDIIQSTTFLESNPTACSIKISLGDPEHHARPSHLASRKEGGLNEAEDGVGTDGSFSLSLSHHHHH